MADAEYHVESMMQSKRIDSASKRIHASASTIYQAFAKPAAMERWLPPHGMTGSMLTFDFREGGSYRMRLTYNEPQHIPGKMSEDADEVEVRFIKLIEDKCIEQAVIFDSEDPAFSGVMRMTWKLESTENGTFVTVCCEDVPEGIRAEDHEAGLESTLGNLAAFLEKGN